MWDVFTDPGLAAFIFVPFLVSTAGAYWSAIRIGRFARRRGLWRWAAVLMSVVAYLIVASLLNFLTTGIVVEIITAPMESAEGFGLMAVVMGSLWAPLLLLVSLAVLVVAGIKSASAEEHMGQTQQGSVVSSIKNIVRRVWRIVRWPIGIIALAFLLLFLYEFARVPGRTRDTVTAIHTQKLTMADVDGSNLPPEPDPKLVDATVEGVDANANGIRDDVELAIYKKYPRDLKTRAAALQYAKAEQRFLTDVFNTETWKAAAEELSRATSCLAETEMNYQDYADFTEYVRTLLADTNERAGAHDRAFEFTTSHGEAPGESCDV